MIIRSINYFYLLVLLLSIGIFNSINAQVPTPEEAFGFKMGADYKMADYGQMLDYYGKLVDASDRIQMVDIGESVMGRPIKLLMISSEENMKQLDKWKEISAKLARAKISDEEAQQLAQEGKAIIWFDAGMHATERAPAQMINEFIYNIVTEETMEMQKIRDEVVTIIVPVMNPDGLEIVTNWYRQNLGTPYETSSPPILYQKYVGHDNNRDWFMNNMQETRAITNVLYNEWYPQIVHNHHQTSPAWARIFLPPFRSPVNSRIHPGVTTGVNLVGTAMANRFAMKKMPGVISNVGYSMYWNGGMRTAPYYHNMIGILTETAHATPTPRYYDPKKKPATIRGLKSDGSEIFYPYPWEGGESHFRDAVDYMLTSSMAILDLAADRKDHFLYNIYAMGRSAIEDKEGPFAYIIPQEQWDRYETNNLVEILLYGGLEGHIAEEDFRAGSTQFKAGDVIFYGAQAFKPFLVDLLEEQDYPDQFQYPGGPPVPPYDLAGWTLPYQMGVNVVRLDTSFEVTTQPIKGKVKLFGGAIKEEGKWGYSLSNQSNAAYKAVNLAHKAGLKVEIAMESTSSITAGNFIFSGENVHNILKEMADTPGLSFEGLKEKPALKTKEIAPIKLGIYKSWVANMDEGWSRWVFEQHGFDLDTLHDADIQSQNLAQYHAIVIPDQSSSRILHGHRKGSMPDMFCGGMGLEGTKVLAEYTRNGGTLITFDRASDFAIDHFGLPIRNTTKGLSDKTFFIPGSLIRARVDTQQPLAFGMQEEIAVSFSRSRAFEIIKQSKRGEGGEEDIEDAPKPKVDVIVEYANQDLLMSGWANGENRYLRNKAAMLDVAYEKGNIVLFGFRPQFRGQPRGTYKLIFNAIHQAALNK